METQTGVTGMMNQIITSQEFIDAAIVAEKVAFGDFEVQVSPAFEIEGHTFRVLMDGHHSLAAALEAGVEPIYVEQTEAESDRIAILASGDIESFLASCWMDGEYHFAATGNPVW